MDTRAEEKRIVAQRNAYTRWVNLRLSSAGYTPPLTSLSADLRSGVPLVRLVESLLGRDLGRYTRHPKMDVHRGENCNLALAALSGDGVSLVNVGSDDIVSGNEKIVLGLIWRLILRYQVGEERDAQRELVEWVNATVGTRYARFGGALTAPASRVERDFSDGLYLLALVHAIVERTGGAGGGGFEFQPQRSARDSAALAVSVAELRLAVPRIIDPRGDAAQYFGSIGGARDDDHGKDNGNDDTDGNGDGNGDGDDGEFIVEKTSMLTYLSLLREAFEKGANTGTGPAVAARSLVDGEGSEAARVGARAAFQIVAFDALGARCVAGADPFACTARITDAWPERAGEDVHVAIEDCGDGTYACHYTIPARPGEAPELNAPPAGAGADASLRLEVTLGGEQVADSPFTVACVAALGGAAGVELGGTALAPAAVAGDPLSLTLAVADGFEAPPLALAIERIGTAGGGPARRDPEARAEDPVTDAATQRVTKREIAITFFDAGRYRISSAIEGLPRGDPAAAALPHEIEVGPAAALASASALAITPPPSGVQAGVATARGAFEVVVRDAFGNAARVAPGDIVLVVEPAPLAADIGTAAAAVDDDDGNDGNNGNGSGNGNGNVPLAITFATTGPHAVRCALRGAAVTGSPAHVDVVAGPPPVAAEVSAPASVAAGAEIAIAVSGGVDASGAAVVAGGHTIVARVVAAEGTAGQWTALSDRGGGRYAGSIVAPKEAGDTELDVAVVPVAHGPAPGADAAGGAASLPGFPRKLVVVPLAADLARSAVRIVPDESVAGADDPVTIVVDVRDAHGNVVSAEDASIAAALRFAGAAESGGEAELTVSAEPVDPATGRPVTWTAFAAPVASGTWAATVTGAGGFSQTAVLEVRAAALDPRSCTVEGAIAGSAPCPVDVPLDARIVAVDRFGNAIPGGASGAEIVLRVSGGGPGDAADAAEVHPPSRVSTTFRAPGTRTVEVLLRAGTAEAAHVRGSPFTVEVTAGTPPARLDLSASGQHAACLGTGPDGSRRVNLVAGARTEITIEAYDDAGARITTGGHAVLAAITRAGGSSGQPRASDDCTVRDNHDGTYTLELYAEEAAGPDAGARLEVSAPGGASSSDTLVVAPAACDPSRCSFEGPTLATKRAETTFTLTCSDRFGNPCPADAAAWSVTAAVVDARDGDDTAGGGGGGGGGSGAGMRAVLAPHADGDGGSPATRFSFSPAHTGLHEVSAEHDGTPCAPGVPLRLVVRTAGPTPRDSTVAVRTSEGAGGGPFPCGVPLVVAVSARDADGPVPFGSGDGDVSGGGAGAGAPAPCPFDVTIEEVAVGVPIDVVLRPVDGGAPGVFEGLFTPEGAGPHRVAAVLRGTHIDASPLEIEAVPGRATSEKSSVAVDASSSLSSGDGGGGAPPVLTLPPGATLPFTVTLRDSYGQQLRGDGAMPAPALAARVTRSDAPETANHRPDLVDGRDGTFRGEVQLAAGPGEYTLQVQLGGVPVAGSPIVVRCETGTDPAASLFAWDAAAGRSPGAVAHGEPCGFTVQSRRAGGAAVACGGDAYAAFALGPDGRRSDIAVEDLGDGRYAGSFAPVLTGPHTVHVLLDGSKPVGGTPAHVDVASGPASAAHCTVRGDGVSESAQLPADTAAVFEVVTHDAHGLACTSGGAQVAASVHWRGDGDGGGGDGGGGGGDGGGDGGAGSAPSTTIADALDGTYKVAYVPEAAGTYAVSVTVGGEPVPGSPFPVRVVPGTTVASMCTLEGSAALAATARCVTAGAEGSFVVVARDAVGNVTGESSVPWEVSAEDAGGARVPVAVEDLGDGTYAVTVRPRVAGPCLLSVKLHHCHVRHSPMQLAVNPAEIEVALCTARVSQDPSDSGDRSARRGAGGGSSSSSSSSSSTTSAAVRSWDGAGPSAPAGAAEGPEIDVSRPFSVEITLVDRFGNAWSAAHGGGGGGAGAAAPIEAAIAVASASGSSGSRGDPVLLGAESFAVRDAARGLHVASVDLSGTPLACHSPLSLGATALGGQALPLMPLRLRAYRVCPHCATGVPAPRFEKHETQCPSRPHRCRHCGQSMVLGEKKSHDKVCPKRRVRCTLCSEPVLQLEYKHHKRTCELRTEAEFQLPRVLPVLGCFVANDPSGRCCVVTEIRSSGTAQLAGVQVGDRIFQLDGVPTPNRDAFRSAVDRLVPGDTATAVLVRGSAPATQSSSSSATSSSSTPSSSSSSMSASTSSSSLSAYGIAGSRPDRSARRGGASSRVPANVTGLGGATEPRHAGGESGGGSRREDPAAAETGGESSSAEDGAMVQVPWEVGGKGIPLDQVRKWRRHVKGEFHDIDFVMEFATQ